MKLQATLWDSRQTKFKDSKTGDCLSHLRNYREASVAGTDDGGGQKTGEVVKMVRKHKAPVEHTKQGLG